MRLEEKCNWYAQADMGVQNKAVRRSEPGFSALVSSEEKATNQGIAPNLQSAFSESAQKKQEALEKYERAVQAAKGLDLDDPAWKIVRDAWQGWFNGFASKEERTY